MARETYSPPVRGIGDAVREIWGLTLTEDSSVGGDGEWLRGGVGVREPSDLTLPALASETEWLSFAPSEECRASCVSGIEAFAEPNCMSISL